MEDLRLKTIKRFDYLQLICPEKNISKILKLYRKITDWEEMISLDICK